MKKLNVTTIIGIILFIIIFTLIVFAPLFTTHDPLKTDSSNRLKNPTSIHIAGTDHYGRDIFSRILYGGRITLSLSIITLFLSASVGVIMGIISALNYKNIIDSIIMRFVDVIIALPFIMIAMFVTAIFGRGLINLLIIVVSTWWVYFARLTRSLVLTIKNDNAILAAKVLGANKFTIIRREIFPKIINTIMISLTFELSSVILSLATLSFFGLGAQPPTPEWGAMLSDGREYFMNAEHVLIYPALFILLCVLCLNLIGEGLRDMFEPYDIPEIK